jgi:hypothetical protein
VPSQGDRHGELGSGGFLDDVDDGRAVTTPEVLVLDLDN